MFSPVHQPKTSCEKQRSTIHQDAVVHTLEIRQRSGRPKREESPQRRKSKCSNRHRRSKPSELERSPRNLRIGRGQAFIEHDSSGQHEGRVVGSHNQRDEGTESDGRTDVDEGEEEIDDGGGANGVEGELGSFIYLGQISRAREPAFPSEGPEHAGGGCEDPYGSEDLCDDYYADLFLG